MSTITKDQVIEWLSGQSVIDLAALVSQLSGDMHTSASTVASLTSSVATIASALADNTAADSQTRAQLAEVSESLADVTAQPQGKGALYTQHMDHRFIHFNGPDFA